MKKMKIKQMKEIWKKKNLLKNKKKQMIMI